MNRSSPTSRRWPLIVVGVGTDVCRYPFNQAVKAFTTTRDQKSEDGKIAIKVMIQGPVE